MIPAPSGACAPGTSIPFERASSLDQAEAFIRARLDAAGFRACLEGPGACSGLMTCRLLAADGEQVATGHGKGDALQSRVGALFEAAEHLLSTAACLSGHAVSLHPVKTILDETAEPLGLPLAILSEQPGATSPVLTYAAPEPHGPVLRPLGLFCPDYLDSLAEDDAARLPGDTLDYGRLQLYSTNSGTACGADLTEAAIHGLLEACEREAISRFLVAAFLHHDASAFRRVGLSDLPPELAGLAANIRAELETGLTILDLPSPTGIPTYCTSLTDTGLDIGIQGFGCSLDPAHALRRSLHEARQHLLILRHGFGPDAALDRSHSILGRLSGLPFHQRCARFQLDDAIARAGSMTAALPPAPYQGPGPRDLPGYLREIRKRITASGNTPLVCDLSDNSLEIPLVHCCLARQDHFFNVLSGQPLLPQLTNSR